MAYGCLQKSGDVDVWPAQDQFYPTLDGGASGMLFSEVMTFNSIQYQFLLKTRGPDLQYLVCFPPLPIAHEVMHPGPSTNFILFKKKYLLKDPFEYRGHRGFFWVPALFSTTGLYVSGDQDV